MIRLPVHFEFLLAIQLGIWAALVLCSSGRVIAVYLHLFQSVSALKCDTSTDISETFLLKAAS